MLRQRLTDPLAAQLGFTDKSFRATGGELSVNNDCRYALDPKSLRSLGYCPILHIEHRDLARVTGDAVYQVDSVVTCRAARAKNFDLPFCAHKRLLLI
jgi:hypothetical protein